jgi:cleavage stimulation factor subunit 2
MVTDLETGKPRGFAFVEFENAQDALSAIRNMNEYELNGRKIRVNFSNSSHLETLAGQLGMDMTQKTKNVPPVSSSMGDGGMGMNNSRNNVGGPGSGGGHAAGHSSGGSSEVGTQAVANALKAMSKGEMYDVILKLKEIADSDPDKARKIISGHPQLPEAILFLMSQLDMMKTAVNTNVLGVGGAAPPVAPGGMVPPPPMMDNTPIMPGRVDPRAAAAAAASAPTNIPPPPAPSDPRDPRNRTDPRRQQQAPPVSKVASAVPPPPPQQMFVPGMPQPPPHGAPPPPPMGVAGLDPSLVQQVMGLTPAQISQLPVDKQTSILALRQQIQNAMGTA